MAGQACSGNHHPGEPMQKLSCLFWTPKQYWIRSNPGTVFPSEADRCLTGPKKMIRETENPWIIKKKTNKIILNICEDEILISKKILLIYIKILLTIGMKISY